MKSIFSMMALLAGLMASIGTKAQVATFDVTNPTLTTSGNYTGQLLASGYYGSPFISSTHTVAGPAPVSDYFYQKIVGKQFSVSAQAVVVVATGAPSGCTIVTEVSNDTGVATNYFNLFTDNITNTTGTAQCFGHMISGWPYTSIRMRWVGPAGLTYNATWYSELVIR